MNRLDDEQVMEEVKHTLTSARKKHPVWPNDIIHASTIVFEEAGELAQATLQREYEGGTSEHCRSEAFHVIATAIRFLTETNFPEMKP